MIDKKNQINGLAKVQCIKTELLKKILYQQFFYGSFLFSAQ